MSFPECFFHASQDLTHVLEKDSPLNDLDRLRLENHLAVIHMAYVGWKQRHGPLPKYLSNPLNNEDRFREDGKDDSRPYEQN